MSYESVIDGLSSKVWTKIDQMVQKGLLEERVTVSKALGKAVHSNKELFTHFINLRLSNKYAGLSMTSLHVQCRKGKMGYINWHNNAVIPWWKSLYVKFRICNNVQTDFQMDPTLAFRLSQLEKKVEEIYNAPGMPGYIQAEQSFEQRL